MFLGHRPSRRGARRATSMAHGKRGCADAWIILVALSLAGCATVPPSVVPSVPNSPSQTATTPAASSASPTSAAPTVADPALAAKLAELTSTAATATDAPATSVLVADGTTGTPLYEFNADSPLAPASTMKSITATASLALLGADHRFRTRVLASAPPANGVVTGDLIIVGGGDPTTTEADYVALAAQVRAVGITKVTGRLLVDSTYFDATEYNAGWSEGHFENVSRPHISGLTISTDASATHGITRHVGSVLVGFSPGAVGKPAKVTLTPAAATGAVTFVNRTTTTASGGGSVGVTRASGTNTITLTGKIGAKQSGGTWPMSVDSPDLVAAAVFRAALVARGVTVGAPQRAATPQDAVDVTAHESAPLSDVIVELLKQSNNGYAEHLMKTLGRAGDSPGTWAGGAARVGAWLTSMGTPAAGLVFRDGSGFSPEDRLTARTLVQTLNHARRQPWFDAFYAALPVAGDPDPARGGTLAKRMTGTPAAGNLRAKTGSLSGVTALAGYVTGADGRLFTVAVVRNGGTGALPSTLEDQVAVLLAGWSHP